MSADAELFEAIEHGDVDRVRALLSAGADPDAIPSGSAFGWRPLHAAIEALEDDRPVATLAVLFEHGLAARRLDIDMVRLLLEAGARADAPDADGWIAAQRVERPDDAEGLERWRQVVALLEQSPADAAT